MASASPTRSGDDSSPPQKKEVKYIWPWTRLFMHLGLAQHQPDAARLFTDIAGLRAWVEAREPTDPRGKLSSETCKRYLDMAREAAIAHSVASGYEYLHIADREAVFLMTQMERKVRAQSLRAEARSSDKFANSWRSKAILSLIAEGRPCTLCGTQENERDVDVSQEALAEAVAHQNTLVRNDHRKIDKMRWQLAWLGFIVGLLVMGALVFAVLAPWLDVLKMVPLLPRCIYLGLLGGFVSSAITQRTVDRKGRVPEIEVSFYAVLARGALGAATSIPVYILARADLIAVGGPAVSQTWGLLFLCFFAGFSERWFLNAVTSVTREDKGSEKSGVGSRQ